MRRNWLRRKQRSKIIVVIAAQGETLTLHGLLWETTPGGVLLRGVEVETPDGKQAMGGEVYLLRERVLFFQSVEGLT